MSEKEIYMKTRYGAYHNYLYEATEDLLFDQLPRIYNELTETEDRFYLEYLDMIHEKMSRAYYEETLTKLLTNLIHENWMSVTVKYCDGIIGVMEFLFQLDKYPFKHSSSEEIMSMLLAMNLTGSKIWIFFKDCCNCDFTLMETVFVKWQEKQISLREISAYVKDGYGKRIDIERL